MTEQDKIKDQIKELHARLKELDESPSLKEGDVYEVWSDNEDPDEIFHIRRFDGFDNGRFMDMFGDSWNYYRKLVIAPEWEDMPDNAIDCEKGDLVACLHEDKKVSIRLASNLHYNVDYESTIVKFLRLPKVD